MARIRTIKPEFPQSESIGRLSRDARLLFIQLWTLADDDGRARAASRMLASLLYPYDDDAPRLIGAWLDELEAEGCIRRYEVDGTHYLDIPNWLKHQKVDHASKSRIPEFRETSRVLAPYLGPRTVDQGVTTASGADAPCERDDWPRDFREQFWAAYPKRVEKQAAFKSLERIRKSGKVPFATILAAVKRYSASVSTTERRYIKDPPTWLNAGCWDDELADVGPSPEAAAAFAVSHIWVSAEDPSFRPLQNRWRLEHRKSIGPPTDPKGGWHFPREWAESTSEAAA